MGYINERLQFFNQFYKYETVLRLSNFKRHDFDAFWRQQNADQA